MVDMKKIAFVLALIAVLLGGLWMLQGLGLVQMQPILCFANCDPIQGPSVTWAVAGAVLLAVGGATIFWSLNERLR